MNSADVLEQIETMGELPILPQTLLQIQRVATDDRSSAEDLAQVILKDQALTMRVLRMVNSAMYQRRSHEKVTTVRKSVIVMGFETVRKLALGLSVFDMMSKLSRSPQLIQIAEHSIVAAAFAQMLAEASKRIAPEEAFVTALVHDIGKLVLVECSPADFDRAMADIAAGRDQIEAERDYFGMSHDRAGRRLAARWKLPSEIQTAIGDHHDFHPEHPPKRMDPSVATIVYADAMAHFRCTDETRNEEFKVMHKAGFALGIPTSRIEDMYENVDKEIRHLAQTMDLSVGNLKQYGQVVNVEGSASVAPKLSERELAERTARQLELYRTVGRGMAERDDPQKLMQRILEGVVNVLGLQRALYFEVDAANRELRVTRGAGAAVDEVRHTLRVPMAHEAGALALCALQRRHFHVPMVRSDAYAGTAGETLLEATRTNGFACAPVVTAEGVVAVLYADNGPDGPDVAAEAATELNGLATQMGLVLSAASPAH